MSDEQTPLGRDRRISGFNVEWIPPGHGLRGGLAITCGICGIHHWRPGDTRLLTEIVVEAAAHREVCP